MIKLFVHIYMSAIAGQTAGPNGLKCFEETHGYPKDTIGLKKFNFFLKFHGQRRALQLVINKTKLNVQKHFRECVSCRANLFWKRL